MKCSSPSVLRSFFTPKPNCFSWVALLIVFLGLPFFSAAQEATIVGTVTDPSGSVVPNVTVTITNVKTGINRTLSTNDVGQYVAPGLPIGTYDLKAEASGFKVEESRGVTLNVNDRIRVDFQMKMGTKAETVSVESNAVAVQTDSSEISSLSSGTQMSELSTNGRSIYTYIILTPGANNLMPSFQNPMAVNANADVSFNGNRPGHNLYLLDGGENYDRGSGGTSSIAPSIDAIAETQTLTSNYSAEYGLSSGGTVSSAVKSGTKDFHFSLWEFFRNDALDARNYFNPAPQPVGELRYNLYGFNAGGPVTFGKLYNPNKNKTFFFYNMEWRDLITAGTPINQPVPPTAYYGGDFSTSGYTLAQLHVPCSNQLSAALQQQYHNAGLTLSTPAADGSCTGAGLQAFPGNVIPASLINSNATALLTAGGKYGGIFPAPTNGNNFQLPVAAPTNVREEIVRIDENVTDKLTIFGHFVAEQASQTFTETMWSGDNVPTVGNTFGNPSYAGVVHAAYVINPTLVNEIAFNYNGNRIHILPTGLYTAPADYTFNRYFDGPNQDNRIPSINLSGSTGSQYTSNWMPWNNDANSYQFRDDVSWTKGRHQLKIGGDYLFYSKAQDWFQTTQGGYTFNGSYSGNDFADFLLGYASNYSEAAVKDTGQWNSTSVGLYLEDNWRVNNRLTLNLGLRWDGIPHTYEANSVMSNFYPNLYNPADAAILTNNNQSVSAASPGLTTSPNPILASLPLYTNGIVVCGVNGTPRGCANGEWKNFGPRLGFAYDLTGSGKTVIRGGYAIMYERIQGNDMYDMAGNVPFAASVNFTNVLLSNPGASVAGTGVAVGIPVSSIEGLAQNYPAPRSTQFSLGIQRAIGANSVLSVSYVGSQNRHQSYLQDIDLPPAGDLPAMQNSSVVAQTYNATLPYLGYNNLLMAYNEANGDYNSVQISFRGNAFSRTLTFQVGYTYSQTNDPMAGTSNSFDLNTVSNPYLGWKYDWGPSFFDIRNTFFTNFVYDIPLLKNSPNHLLKTTLGGWEVSGIVTAQSGAPLNIGVTGSNVCSLIPGSPATSCNNRPDLTGPLSNPHTPNEWFDTAAFAQPAAGTWGNTPHNYVRGPGLQNWNISLFKNFLFNEERGTNLQFRAEFFNIWNHPNFIGNAALGGISTNLGANNFGQVTGAYDPREIQLALKFMF
ncbi:MAG TPA: carboxypeptidase regulatory-like domain-containing protein [Verrucomicrobiae bacterium]|nr:carboxypeptidase regulatory-like domain-containing protein [Verrucomicrobiae bacterium]